MIKIQHQKGHLTLYDSVKDLPIDRYQAFQKYLIQESHIGSDIGAIGLHFQRLDTLLQAGQIPQAQQERQNMHVSFFSILEGLNFQSKAFVCLLKSVEVEGIAHNVGNIEDDTEVDNALDLIKVIELTQGDIEGYLFDVKKKLMMN